jgi:hypothetical protein
MKKFVTIFLLVAACQARADFVIVENVRSTDKGNPGESLTIKIKGDVARVETNVPNAPKDALKVIHLLDTYSYDVTYLYPKKKEFDRHSTNWPGLENLMKLEQENPDIGGGPDAAVKLVDTGRSEKVGDYNAEIYTAETPKLKFTMWVTKDVPDYAVLRDLMRRLHAMMAAIPYTPKIDGVAVRTETVRHGQTITISLASVKKADVHTAEVEIPTAYTEATHAPLNQR